MKIYLFALSVLVFASNLSPALAQNSTPKDRKAQLAQYLSSAKANATAALKSIYDYSANSSGEWLGCNELKVGEVRSPKIPFYQVTRTRADSYLLEFNMEFSAGEKVTDQEALKYRETVKECLSNTYLTVSTGEKVYLKLTEPATSWFSTPWANRIKIHRGIRSNSMNYDINLRCSGIFHELLHLTGLWDEYYEDKYSCRNTSTSVMGDHYAYDYTSEGLMLFRGTKKIYPLQPAHLRKLIHPSCPGVNKVYDVCTDSAYQQDGKCGEKPSFCRYDVWKQ